MRIGTRSNELSRLWRPPASLRISAVAGRPIELLGQTLGGPRQRVTRFFFVHCGARFLAARAVPTLWLEFFN